MGFKRLLDNLRLCNCMPDLGPQVLRINLMSVAGLRLNSSDFYIEAWAEPTVGHPKNSRIHAKSCGEVDLGKEELEIDWYGDETEVVIHVVQRTAKQSTDLPVFELRIPRTSIERYAAERDEEACGSQRGEPGARNFRMSPLKEQEALQRKQRFQDMLLPSGLALRLFQMLGEGHMLHITSAAELESLQKENEALRKEHTSLCCQTGQPPAAGSAWAAKDGRATAGIVLSFEIAPRRGSIPELIVRKASFQEIIAAD